jgi:hypothetical protein
MNPNTAQLLRQGLLTLLVVSATLTAYDRLVLRPALLIGVVDVAEVYRAKEAEFTQMLTKASSEDDRQKALFMARSFAQRLPVALRNCRANAVAWSSSRRPWPERPEYRRSDGRTA